MTVSIRRPFQPLADGDPSQVGRYQLLARLGAGGFGTVYLGQNDTGELAAVKVVHPISGRLGLLPTIHKPSTRHR